MAYSVNERNCLRFYQGTVQSYEINEGAEYTKYSSAFYQTEKAYELLNMLLYPGINNEYARICSEARRVPYLLLRNMEEILYVYEMLFRLMCKCSLVHSGEQYYLYRKDRMQSMEMVNAGYTFGFTSCSLDGSADKYFIKKKDGILLLELMVSGNIPHADVNEILGENQFSTQKEILLPPFVGFQKMEIPFTEEEMIYEDKNHEPPKAKYLLKVMGMHFGMGKGELGEIFAGVDMAETVLSCLEEGRSVCLEDQRAYCVWKDHLQKYLKMRFAEICRESGIK